MSKRTLLILLVIVLIAGCWKLLFWSVRDYYYQLKYGIFMVDYELQGKDRELYRASIKKLTSGNLTDTIDSSYFELVGVHQWARMPTVYPYAMNFFYDMGYESEFIGRGAFLTNARHVDYKRRAPDNMLGGEAYYNDAYGDLAEENIIAFSFNDTYLIGKKTTAMENNIPTSTSVTSYFIVEFTTGKIKRFTTYKELMKEANTLGYKRHKFPLDYTKETDDAKAYTEAERSKVLTREEPNWFPASLCTIVTWACR